jgi:hypothetical protein
MSYKISFNLTREIPRTAITFSTGFFLLYVYNVNYSRISQSTGISSCGTTCGGAIIEAVVFSNHIFVYLFFSNSVYIAEYEDRVFAGGEVIFPASSLFPSLGDFFLPLLGVLGFPSISD